MAQQKEWTHCGQWIQNERIKFESWEDIEGEFWTLDSWCEQ